MSNRKQKNVLIALLVLILAGSLGYNLILNRDVGAIANKIKGKDTLINRASQEKEELKLTLNNLSSEFESLTIEGVSKDSILVKRANEISSFKGKINKLLKQDKLNDRALKKAKSLLKTYAESLKVYKADYLKLKEENKILQSENTNLQSDLERVTGLQSDAEIKIQEQTEIITQKSNTIKKAGQPTLSYLKIEPYKQRSSGKLVETSRARRVDLMNVSFELKGNEFTQDKNATLYLAIYKPDNKLAKLSSQTLGELTLNDGESRFYSEKFEMNLGELNKKQISFDWKKETFEKGDYRFIIYSQGEIIHSENVSLK